MPTTHTITERLVKIRFMIKNNGAAHFPVYSPQTKGIYISRVTPHTTLIKPKAKSNKVNSGAGTVWKRGSGKNAKATKKRSDEEESEEGPVKGGSVRGRLTFEKGQGGRTG
ncbi:hypothetical protein MMC06_004235 [Schaereria dolodes]|nr:hypothetical protein [Schaereria dolodes]